MSLNAPRTPTLYGLLHLWRRTYRRRHSHRCATCNFAIPIRQRPVKEIASIHRLSLAQVYDALSYYYDNEGEIEHYIHNELWGAS